MFALPSGSAHADDVTGSYSTAIGAGTSTQFMAWNKPLEKVRLRVTFGGNAEGSGDRCQDAAVDWNTNGTGHYDARVVRNCNPGHTEETDPDGNDWWQEPSNFQDADVRRVQRVGSYVFDDSDLTNITNSSNAYGSEPSRAYGTGDWSQRIRTLYDDGDVVSHEHNPARCAGNDTWIGGPGHSGFCA